MSGLLPTSGRRQEARRKPAAARLVAGRGGTTETDGVLTCLHPEATTSSGTFQAMNDSIDTLRFGVLSDIHLLDPALALPEGAARTDLFRTALARFRDRGVDAVLVCGDLTHNGFVTELEEVARVWFEVFPEGRLPDGRRVANLMLYGDHDMEGRIRKGESARRRYAERGLPLPQGLDEGGNRFAVWERLFGEKWEPLKRVAVKGHDFLLRSFAPEYMGRSPGLAEAVAAVRAENPDRPFFYAQHRTIPGTCRFRDHVWGAEDGAGDCRRVLDGCPEAVAFFGHTHCSPADEQAAWQGGFTAINAGGLVTSAVPRGRENSTGISWLADDPAPFSQMQSVPSGAAHGAMVVAVDGRRLRVERIDVETGLPLGPDWEIETGPEAIARGAFGNAARAASAGPPPQFPEGAAISLEDVPGGADRSGASTPQLRVRFPRAETQPGGLRALDYRVRAETLAFGEPRLILEKRVLSPGANRPEALDTEPPCCVFSRAELAAPGPLRFTAAPMNAWGQEGRAIATASGG